MSTSSLDRPERLTATVAPDIDLSYFWAVASQDFDAYGGIRGETMDTLRDTFEAILKRSTSREAAQEALHTNGLTGERVLKLARRIATDAQHRAPAGLGGKYEDLVSFLTLQALEAAIRYDPRISGNGYTFASYLCDIMERRVPDFYRRKSEGFGDRRSGSDNRLTLTGDTEDFDTDVDFEQLVSERRAGTWHQAADRIGLPFTAWVVQTLDQAAARQLRHAA